MSYVSLLTRYIRRTPEEASSVSEALESLTDVHEALCRDNLPGHITASAMIIDPLHCNTALIFHKKLKKWLQPGGHADGNPDLASVALREAQEETGLGSLRLADDEVFDFGITPIPSSKTVPAHVHFDVRFLLWADSEEKIGASEETLAGRWVHLKELETYTADEGILRMKRKYEKRARA